MGRNISRISFGVRNDRNSLVKISHPFVYLGDEDIHTYGIEYGIVHGFNFGTNYAVVVEISCIPHYILDLNGCMNRSLLRMS